MNILFIHQNFPGQFKHLAPALCREHNVVAMTLQNTLSDKFNGVQIVKYSLSKGTTPNIHKWASEFEAKLIRAEAVYLAALKMQKEGFTPDIIVAHPGWGESLFIKDVWTNAKLGIYCEFYYDTKGTDVGFDKEFADVEIGDVCRIRAKNANNLLHFEIADAGISPTKWQADTFPDIFRDKITVIHDGINTNLLSPNNNASLILNGNIKIGKEDEIITFVNRNLEPYRGYHSFMRSLPKILKDRPSAKILIVGGSGISYGANAPDGTNWRDIFFSEVREQVSNDDWKRVYYLGNIPYDAFTTMLQISTVHVYLTYPFVLSWSLLEAMSIGCAIVASNTEPVREAIKHNETGLLVDFFNYEEIANTVCSLLSDGKKREQLGMAARRFAISHYDLKTVCLPAQLEWVTSLANK